MSGTDRGQPERCSPIQKVLFRDCNMDKGGTAHLAAGTATSLPLEFLGGQLCCLCKLWSKYCE